MIKRNFPTFAVAAIFGIITCIVLVAFHPAKEFVCGPSPKSILATFGQEIMGSKDRCFGGLLFDYQSLIGGVLAVAAALFTINRMKQDNDAADRRHQEELEIQRRPNRLLLERSVLPWLHKLETNLDTIRRADPGPEWTIENVSSMTRYNHNHASEVSGSLTRIIGILDAAPWAEIEDLLDHQIFAAKDSLHDFARYAQNSLDHTYFVDEGISSDEEETSDEKDLTRLAALGSQLYAAKPFIGHRRDLVKKGDELCSGLRALLSRYGSTG